MARKYEVTRTIENTKATAIVFNKTTAEAENLTMTFAGRYTADDPKLAKLFQKSLVTPDLVFVEIVEADSANKTYGITLNDFMEKAVELDPKTRQPIAE